MYHCHLHFYLVGRSCRTFEIIKEISPLDHFTHEFWESERPEGALVKKADVILAVMQGADSVETLHALLSDKAKDAELILLANQDGFQLPSQGIEEVKDIWRLPMSDEELLFRFHRWQ